MEKSPVPSGVHVLQLRLHGAEKGTSAKSSLFGRACTSPKAGKKQPGSGHEPLVPLGRWDVFRLSCKLGCVWCSSVCVLPYSEPEEETKLTTLARDGLSASHQKSCCASALVSVMLAFLPDVSDVLWGYSGADLATYGDDDG